MWAKTKFDAPAEWDPQGVTPLAIDLTGASKGHLYVNGFDCGKYWLRGGSAAEAQRFYQLPQDKVVQKGNLLVLFEEIGIANYTALRVVAPVVASRSTGAAYDPAGYTP